MRRARGQVFLPELGSQREDDGPRRSLLSSTARPRRQHHKPTRWAPLRGRSNGSLQPPCNHAGLAPPQVSFAFDEPGHSADRSPLGSQDSGVGLASTKIVEPRQPKRCCSVRARVRARVSVSSLVVRTPSCRLVSASTCACG